MNPTRLTNEMSSSNLTFSQKIVQTIKRFAVGLPMLFHHLRCPPARYPWDGRRSYRTHRHRPLCEYLLRLSLRFDFCREFLHHFLEFLDSVLCRLRFGLRVFDVTPERLDMLLNSRRNWPSIRPC